MESNNGSCISHKSDTSLCDVNSGVSTPYAYDQATLPSNKHWYALRTTYNREQKAYDYLLSQGCELYLPWDEKIVLVKGKRVKKKVSRIPNIFFAHSTFDELMTFVYDNVNLPFLRFYYDVRHTNMGIERHPLIVPDRQIQSLKIICDALSQDVLMVPGHVKNFAKGQRVYITDGPFLGIEGRVARWHGQQRVAVIIENLCTIATAYIPSAFLRVLDK